MVIKKSGIHYLIIAALFMLYGGCKAVAPNTIIGCVTDPNGYYSQYCGFNEIEAIAITPDSKKVYVANYNGNSVTVIDVATDTIIDCLEVPSAYSPNCGLNNPVAIAITPDGTKVYVCNSNGVAVFDVASDTFIECVTNPHGYSCAFDGAVGIAITPYGDTAYVVNQPSATVSVIDVASNTIIGCVTDPHGILAMCRLDQAYGITITPDGTRAYIPNISGNSVTVIDTTNNTFIACVTNPHGYPCAFDEPADIAITGNTAYVANAGGDSVSIVDVASNTIIGCVTNPGYSCGFNGPYALAITPDGKTAYVVNSGGPVSIVDIASNAIIGCVTNPDGYPCGFNFARTIAITPDGTKAYVGNERSNTMSVIALFVAPHAPTNLSGCILQEGTTITNTISWDAPASGVAPTSYNIYRDSYMIAPIATVPAHGYGPFVYEDVGLDPNQTYTYYIESIYDPLGTVSAPASITISSFCYPELFPPSALSSSCMHGQIILMWDQPTSGATPTEYEIYSDATLTNLLATVPADGYTTFVYETGTSVSHTYYIVSVDSYGDKSEPATITAPGCTSVLPPASVSGCKTQNRFMLQTDFINNITWTAPASGSAPVAYKIYRDAYLTELVAMVPASGALQYYDHGRNPNITYSYYIVSVDSNGNVSAANSVTVTQNC